ncbi:MAG: type IV pilus secretin PilQ [candidate division NC10 bacterium]|nr:type IV pilus secretin PilQ [candidate division NC10 bacterium]
MMERATTSRTAPWAVGVLVGVVTVSWIVMSTVLVPVARAAVHEIPPESTAPAVAPAFTPPDGVTMPLPAPGAVGPAVAATPSEAPNRVTGVELTEVGPMSATIQVKTDRAVESYESFALPDPPRLVIDILNAVHAASKVAKARGPITGIRASQYKTRPVKVVRIVLDLTAPLPYQVQATLDPFQVVIGEAAAGTVKAEAPSGAEISAQAKEEPPTTLPQAPAPLPETVTGPPRAEGRVEGVEYRPKDGQAEILVRTSGQVTFNVSEVSTPPGLILEVSGAVIDPQAAKVLDVRQLPGPVQRIRAAQHRLEPEKAVRIVADLKGQVRYNVVEIPEGIRLELEAMPAVAAAPPAAPAEAKPEERPAPPLAPPVAAAPPPEPPAAKGLPPEPAARLSMDFKDVDINNLLRIIAEVSEQNIVAGQDVRGKVTVRLVDVPWDVALDNILRINGFGFIREDNIIRIAKLDTIRKEQETRRKEQRLLDEGELEPLTTEILRVSYADAKAMVANLAKVKSKRGSISVDERTSSLLIQDTARSIRNMRKILEVLDQPTPQVMIEARIVTVDSKHTRSLGIQWGFQGTNQTTGTGGTSRNAFILSDVFGATGANLAGPPNSPSVVGATTIPAAVNLPAPTPLAGIGFVLGRINNSLRLNFQLTALEQQSLARTLSTPRIVALDNQEAEIKQGEDIPFTTVDSSGRTTVTFEEAVLSLKVTPHVTADKRIQLKIKATDDTVGDRIDFAGGFAFAFNRNEATSSLLVDNGATVVIGGVRKSKENVTEDRVPFLGTIPILGWLFKRRTENLAPETTELLIFVTPTILELPRRAGS